MQTVDLLIRNIGQLATIAGEGPRMGPAASELGIIENGAVAAIDGRIVAAGPESEVLAVVEPDSDCAVIDAGAAVVTPGFVDPHTHAVFARTREDEFAMRVEGRSYEEIAAAGGGIRSSVRHVRAATDELLFRNGARALDRMLEYGTTTAEIKSGYGLSLEAELKMLRVISKLAEHHAVDVVPTFLGAHEFPDEWRDDRDGYVTHLIDEIIPLVAREGLAEFCDVFCEEDVFTVEQSRRLLLAAASRGLRPKLHADELHASGGGELAAEVGAISADHLVCVSDAGIRAMANAGVVAVLLPGTTLSLGKRDFAPARKFVDAGVPVALATDCNPGSSMTESMQIIVSLASMVMRLTPAEALVAATADSAPAVGRSGSVGSIEPGKLADLIVWEVVDYRAIPYHYGVNLTRMVIKRGAVVSGESPAAASTDGGSR